MAKKKKKSRAVQVPPDSFSVTPEQVMKVLRFKAQYDRELRLHIEAAQWEAGATAERLKVAKLEAKLVELQSEEDEAGEEQ